MWKPRIRTIPLLLTFLLAHIARADPLPKDVTDAVAQLPASDEAARQRIYAILAEKGDARLIPLLNAYRDGALQFRDNHFIIYGPLANIPGQGMLLPLLDGLTGEPILGPDGKPAYVAKADLSKAIKAPPRAERRAILDLISGS